MMALFINSKKKPGEVENLRPCKRNHNRKIMTTVKIRKQEFCPTKFLKGTMKEEITFYNYYSSLSRHSSKVEQEKSYPVSDLFIVTIPKR